ncbi:MAG: hypothetical protein IT293_16580 [Deltaproteobacteria bacterium]|nr:hypothetical protein [Deltaproteobacteria bacterium]
MKVMLAALLCCLALAVGPSAEAYDLTGTWVGKWSCKGFDGVKFTSGNKASTLRITQSGNAIAAELDNGVYRYNGGAIPDIAKPDKGEAALVACPNDNVPLSGGESEIMRAAVKTKASTFKAALKALSVFEDGSGGVGTCKYSFKRVDPVNPNVPDCPA